MAPPPLRPSSLGLLRAKAAWWRHRAVLLPVMSLAPALAVAGLYVAISGRGPYAGLAIFAVTTALASAFVWLVSLSVHRRTVAREAASAARALSEQRYREFEEMTSIWIWETDAEDRFTHVTGTGERTTPSPTIGRKRADMIEHTLEHGARETHLAALARREPFRDFVYRLRRVDGSSEW